MAKTVIWAAVLLAYGVSTAAAMKSCKPGPSTPSPLPLDMAPNSVDDMYDGCHEDMAKDATRVLQNERNKYGLFKQAWSDAEKVYKKKRMKPRLGREQVIAIYVYTSDSVKMYEPFNDAVRTQGPQYNTTTFKFHALHFYLTDAVQRLNARRLKDLHEGEDKCFTVYRRDKVYFQQDVVKKQVRFGSFTSSSKRKDLKKFGDKSCFEIVTCMGADISMHSKYENEAEVLIPPYEVFKVTEIQKTSEELQCDVFYKLKSTGETLSNFNCELFPRKKEKGNTF